jgi:hypothetical protein
MALLFAVVAACSTDASGKQSQQGGYAVGRVTFEGGGPITGDVQDYTINISGVSEAGVNVYYTPIVKNGGYRQKLVPGQFRFGYSNIKVKFGDNVYTLELVPVGPNWNKNQDAADGIVQDFVWKPTGLGERVDGKPDPNNATNWHGLSIGMQYQMYRSDIKQSTKPLPDGTKLVFTLTPTSKSIDGRDLQPIIVERVWRLNDVRQSDDLNDLPVATYEITGIAKLPDGSTKPILVQSIGRDPGFVAKGIVPVMPGSSGGMWKMPFGWVTD